MARLVYSALASLDGFIADEQGRFDWAMPDEEVHRFINELERPAGLHLYGRRMYETMRVWESPEMSEGQPPHIREYAEIWRAADKVVYSTTLAEPSTARTRIERSFDAGQVRRWKQELPGDIAIAGPTLAAHAMREGLVDVVHLFVAPVVIGGGLSAFPRGVALTLELGASRSFGNGMVYLGYEAR